MTYAGSFSRSRVIFSKSCVASGLFSRSLFQVGSVIARSSGPSRRRIRLRHRHERFARSLEWAPAVRDQHVVDHENIPALPGEGYFGFGVGAADFVEHGILDGRTVAVVSIAGEPLLLELREEHLADRGILAAHVKKVRL